VLSDVVGLLRCPHCAGDLARSDDILACAAGHTFDIARRGHVTLLSGGGHGARGDTSEMVAARAAFLDAGHYGAIASALADTCAKAAPGPETAVLDVGAGTGHYLAAVLEAVKGAVGVALDASPAALRRAARAHPRIGAVGGDTWRALPLKDSSVAIATTVFAPRNGAELARVIAPGGTLVVVTPTVRHLAELRAPLGLLSVDPDKAGRLERQLEPHLTAKVSRTVEYELALAPADVRNLAAMGPSAWHADAATLAATIAALPPWTAATVSVTLSSFRRT